jgi:hypothetical protein
MYYEILSSINEFKKIICNLMFVLFINSFYANSYQNNMLIILL